MDSTLEVGAHPCSPMSWGRSYGEGSPRLLDQAFENVSSQREKSWTEKEVEMRTALQIALAITEGGQK